MLPSTSPCALPKRAIPEYLIPLTSVVAGDKARLVVASNTVNLVIVTAVIDGDKARLLVRGNPVIAVVATDVAFHLPLRTAEKRNP
jgi:hypothetical protein